jgi:hypothetical protein
VGPFGPIFSAFYVHTSCVPEWCKVHLECKRPGETHDVGWVVHVSATRCRANVIPPPEVGCDVR